MKGEVSIRVKHRSVSAGFGSEMANMQQTVKHKHASTSDQTSHQFSRVRVERSSGLNGRILSVSHH